MCCALVTPAVITELLGLIYIWVFCYILDDLKMRMFVAVPHGITHLLPRKLCYFPFTSPPLVVIFPKLQKSVLPLPAPNPWGLICALIISWKNKTVPMGMGRNVTSFCVWPFQKPDTVFPPWNSGVAVMDDGINNQKSMGMHMGNIKSGIFQSGLQLVMSELSLFRSDCWSWI